MNNLKEMIKDFDYIRLDVIDAWQFPAVYIVYKNGIELEDITDEFFVKELDKDEYNDFIFEIEKLSLDEWNYDYLPDRNEKIEEEYTWKVIVSQNGKKVVKKGRNKSPDNFGELENLMIRITSAEDEV